MPLLQFLVVEGAFSIKFSNETLVQGADLLHISQYLFILDY